jgi:hypothetical protein
MRFLYFSAPILSLAMTATAAIVAMPTMTSTASAQANRIFEKTSHDFGSVAKAAKTEFRFYFENPYDQPMHVRSVRTSCGCTTPILETQVVPPKGKGSILAKFNTHTHVGQKGATLTVTVERPFFAEYQLHVKGYIRTDVVFNPGEANFGNIQQGSPKGIQVSLDYAGRPDWKILGLTTSNDFLTAVAREKSRNGGRIQYQIDLTMGEDAPAGVFESELIVSTNDRNLTRVPLRVTANIVPGVTAVPSTVSLGDVLVAVPVRQLVVLKGQNPFVVKGVESNIFDIDVELGAEPRTLHPLQLRLTPKAGELGKETQGTIKFMTDSADRPEIEIGAVYRTKSPAPIIERSLVTSDDSIEEDDL